MTTKYDELVDFMKKEFDIELEKAKFPEIRKSETSPTFVGMKPKPPEWKLTKPKTKLWPPPPEVTRKPPKSTDFAKAKLPKLGIGTRFKNLVEELEQKKGCPLTKTELEEVQNISKEIRDPKALAAWIGRRKYGKKKFQEMAAAGRKKKD